MDPNSLALLIYICVFAFLIGIKPAVERNRRRSIQQLARANRQLLRAERLADLSQPTVVEIIRNVDPYYSWTRADEEEITRRQNAARLERLWGQTLPERLRMIAEWSQHPQVTDLALKQIADELDRTRGKKKEIPWLDDQG